MCTRTIALYDSAMKADVAHIGWIGSGAEPLDEAVFGTKAARLCLAARLGLPVPPGFVLAGDVNRADLLEAGLAGLAERTGRRMGDPDAPLLVSLRASSTKGASASVPAVLNLGICAPVRRTLEAQHGPRMAADLYRRMIQSFGIGALEIEGEEFEYALHDALKAAGLHEESELDTAALGDLADTCLGLIDDEAGETIPETAEGQLTRAIAAIATRWSSPRARRRRAGKGLEEDAPLALIVQEMAIGLQTRTEERRHGAGTAHFRDASTGHPALTGRFLFDAQGDEAMLGLRTPVVLGAGERLALGISAPSLEEAWPDATRALQEAARRLEQATGQSFSLDFTLCAEGLRILELLDPKFSARAMVQVTTDLVGAGAIGRDAALTRIDPVVLDAHLHPMIDPGARRDQIGSGLPASPGAASGPLVFTPAEAEIAAATGKPAVLALIETSPEDIRGMHAAAGVLTVRGGMTSHAAVVARGLGTPCVVGAQDLELDVSGGVLTARDGRTFGAGDIVTVVGGEGQVLAGAVTTIQPEVTGAFATLMDWADEARVLGVRANADSARDAAVAFGFKAGGIGLCRTEHMFFQAQRINVMREMILAPDTQARQVALDKLMPMQRADFTELFKSVGTAPVVIRLLDPPLHEFLPHGWAEMSEMAREMALPVELIQARAQELSEFNPMLGKRGCRIGIAYPEIYRMQATAIFESACDVAEETGAEVAPEIMIPLISVVRELELLGALIRETAEEVTARRGTRISHTVGVMIETPRACLRAGDIARHCDFLSFGTNDLTQMLYGLSRDDAGRFMPDYVSREVFPQDPFHQIDEEGVGEIIQIAIARARAAKPGIPIGLCGEHGGDPASIDFCQRAGFDYVSCSPFRVPIARLASAQAAIRAKA